MSKTSRRPGREEIKTQRRKKKQLEKELRDTQRSQGLTPESHASSANATSPYDSVEADVPGQIPKECA